MVGRTNAGGGGSTSLPTFEYTGTYTLIDDSATTGQKGDWRIKFLTSGTLTFTKLGKGDGYLDIFCVGGGGGSASGFVSNYGTGYAGGGGGYTALSTATIAKNTSYAVTVGAAGTSRTQSDAYGSDGGASSFSSIASGSGGKGAASVGWGGAGGSGGACMNPNISVTGYAGGYDGSNGSTNDGSRGGSGMGTYASTGIYYVREFRESGGDVYSAGGSVKQSPVRSVVANSGDGGYVNSNGTAVGGATGIVVIRNHR